MRRLALRLRTRLIVSYAVVVATGVTILAVTFRLLDPFMFDRGLGQGTHGTVGPGRTLHAAFYSALNWSLLVSLAVSLLVGVLAARLAARRILRPLGAVRAATRRLAAGRYEEQVPAPLEPELAALADDVNHLAAALADAEVRRARLVGELAHELRTPVTTLRGLLEGALDGVITLDPELLASALEETGRLERLAGDLAELSRAEERALNLRWERVDLTDLAARAATRLSPQFDDKGVRLEVTPRARVFASADPERVQQVLTNLFGNALRATPRGGVVKVVTVSAGRTARISVEDDGVGLDDDELRRVFDRFWRGASPGGPGTGIGLTIARAIAEAHGGALTAASPGRGRGASFTLELPVDRVPPDPPAEPGGSGVEQR
ncbi:MAG TPA: ATP-binding protein [Acidimicrobiales bacterium]|nr:ATP-binding protein [Acidimicrobiales bacterium]